MHVYAVKHGLDAELFVCNVMIDVYGKLGVLEEARRVFDGMKMRDLVTWNSIISGYDRTSKVGRLLLLSRCFRINLSLFQVCSEFAVPFGSSLPTSISLIGKYGKTSFWLIGMVGDYAR